MSIVALKRKTATKYGKLSSRGSEGFSLNNPRRVDSHHNQVQTQTPMKGNAPRGHGSCCGKFNVKINNSQYKNYDNMTRSEVGNQGISVKNHHGSMAIRNKWLKRGYPYTVVKNMTPQDQSFFIENKSKNAICNNFADISNVIQQDSCVGSVGCKKSVSTTIVKNLNTLSQGEYLRGRLMAKNCLNNKIPGLIKIKLTNDNIQEAVNLWLSNPTQSTILYGVITKWDVSKVTDMSGLFQDATYFNNDIGDWDVASVTNMNNMFNGATAFNQNLIDWDVASVTNMNNMFNDAAAFNQTDLRYWNVEISDTTFDNMFSSSGMVLITGVNAEGTIDDVSHGDWFKSYIMTDDNIYTAVEYWKQDNSTNNYGHISFWDTKRVTDMSGLFQNASEFNGDITEWDVTGVKDMSRMFNGASQFDQSLNSWDVSGVEDMNNMFNGATTFNKPLNNWNVANVKDMNYMFNGATTFDQSINTWDVSGVTDMNSMFNGATAFNQPINTWDVMSVTNMNSMFKGATSFDQPDIQYWDISTNTDTDNMFLGSDMSSNTGINADKGYDSTPGSWFYKSLTNDSTNNIYEAVNDWVNYYYEISGIDTMSFQTYGPIEKWKTSQVTDMSGLFQDASGFNDDISGWDVASVTYMNYMFKGTNAFNQPLNNWDVANVKDMNNMFYNAVSFNRNIGSWKTGSVENMSYMFYQARAFNKDISGWDTENVKNMSYMFSDASFNKPLNTWNVANVEDMTKMFKSNEVFNKPLHDWDVSSVVTMNGMFEQASGFNQDISSWDVSGVTDMTDMFLSLIHI